MLFIIDWVHWRGFEAEFTAIVDPTWLNDRDDVSSFQAGLVDGGRADLRPVDHLLHAVVGHPDDELALRR